MYRFKKILAAGKDKVKTIVYMENSIHETPKLGFREDVTIVSFREVISRYCGLRKVIRDAAELLSMDPNFLIESQAKLYLTCNNFLQRKRGYQGAFRLPCGPHPIYTCHHHVHQRQHSESSLLDPPPHPAPARAHPRGWSSPTPT